MLILPSCNGTLSHCKYVNWSDQPGAFGSARLLWKEMSGTALSRVLVYSKSKNPSTFRFAHLLRRATVDDRW